MLEDERASYLALLEATGVTVRRGVSRALPCLRVFRQRAVSRARLGGVAAVVAAAALVLASWPDAGAAARDPNRQPPLSFGAYVPGAPDGGIGAVDLLEQDLGRRVRVVLWYQAWDGSRSLLQKEWLERVRSSRRVPLLTWEPWRAGHGVNQPAYSLRNIAAGVHDEYVRAFARAVASYGSTVYLRPMHEMNGDWYPWAGGVNGNDPDDFRRAWRHLHDLFAQEGATNVRWVFSPYVVDVPGGNRFELYYPRARYVDVLALDGYNWGTCRKEFGGWRSFDELFSSAYRRLLRLGRQPVWIAETATAPDGGDKAGWVRSMFASAASFRRLAALVWFDADKECDWRAATTPALRAAFREGKG